VDSVEVVEMDMRRVKPVGELGAVEGALRC
jgi:hypothetical protein